MFVSAGSRAGRGAAINTLYTRGLPIQLVYAATVTIDLNFGKNVNFVIGSLTGNITLRFINGRPGQSGGIKLKQDGTGSRTLTLSSTAPYHTLITAGGAPTLSTAASSDDELFYYVETPTVVKLSLAKAFA